MGSYDAGDMTEKMKAAEMACVAVEVRRCDFGDGDIHDFEFFSGQAYLMVLSDGKGIPACVKGGTRIRWANVFRGPFSEHSRTPRTP